MTAPEMRLETIGEHIARDMREGRFPAQSEPQMVPVTPPPRTYTEAEVQAMVAAAVMEAAEAVEYQSFHIEMLDKAAARVRALIRPDAMAALEAYRDREVAKAMEGAAAKQDARCAYWVARLEGGLPKKSVAATQGRVAGHYTAAEDIRAMIPEVKP